MSDDAVVSQIVVEAETTDKNVRSSQVTINALSTDKNVRASQAVLEVGSTEVGWRASQIIAEIATTARLFRASQIVLEILVSNVVPHMQVFPTLIGLTYNVVKRPKFSTGVGVGTSGAEVRVGYWATPLWEWDLIFDYLPDTADRSGTTASDLKTLMGFYCSVFGGLLGFFFDDPDDDYVKGQNLGTGDGAAQQFFFRRTFGLGGYGAAGTTTEYVGGIKATPAVAVYLNGGLVSPTAYDVITTTPLKQYVQFHVAPGVGQVVTADFGYYYYVRFKDDTYDFEKFMDKLWDTQRITLVSLRNN